MVTWLTCKTNSLFSFLSGLFYIPQHTDITWDRETSNFLVLVDMVNGQNRVSTLNHDAMVSFGMADHYGHRKKYIKKHKLYLQSKMTDSDGPEKKNGRIREQEPFVIETIMIHVFHLI